MRDPISKKMDLMILRKFVGVIGIALLLGACKTALPPPLPGPENRVTVDVENQSDRQLEFTVMHEDSVAGLSFGGRLQPSETSSFDVSIGRTYHFNIVDPATLMAIAGRRYEVWAYTKFVFDGSTLQVSDESVRLSNEQLNVLKEPPRAFLPVFVGTVNTAFHPVAGPDGIQFAASDESHVIGGLSGHHRIFTDYLGLMANLAYGYGPSFHEGYISFGPTVRFRPRTRVDPYLFLSPGVTVFFPREIEFGGQEVDPGTFGLFTMDYGGGIAFGLTSRLHMDGQARLHRMSLDPVFDENQDGFDENELISGDSETFREFRIGIRYLTR